MTHLERNKVTKGEPIRTLIGDISHRGTMRWIADKPGSSCITIKGKEKSNFKNADMVDHARIEWSNYIRLSDWSDLHLDVYRFVGKVNIELTVTKKSYDWAIEERVSEGNWIICGPLGFLTSIGRCSIDAEGASFKGKVPAKEYFLLGDTVGAVAAVVLRIVRMRKENRVFPFIMSR